MFFFFLFRVEEIEEKRGAGGEEKLGGALEGI